MSKRHHSPYTEKQKADILQKAEAKFAEGWSNNKVAKHVGVNPRTLTKWLNEICDDGKTTVPIDEEEKTTKKAEMTISVGTASTVTALILHKVIDEVAEECVKQSKRSFVIGFGFGALVGSVLTMLSQYS